MLAGRLLFEGSTAADVLKKHLTQEPPPLRSLATTVTDSTVHAVERCLAKDPAARWPDARSLKLALGAVEESPLPDALHAVEAKGVPGAAMAMLFFLFILVIFVGEATGPLPQVVSYSVPAGVAGAMAFGYLLLLTSLRREGFSIRQSQAAIWREPSTRPEPSRRSDTPHDQLQSILRHGEELSGPLRPLGAQAAVAARQLVASIRARRSADRRAGAQPGARGGRASLPPRCAR